MTARKHKIGLTIEKLEKKVHISGVLSNALIHLHSHEASFNHLHYMQSVIKNYKCALATDLTNY